MCEYDDQDDLDDNQVGLQGIKTKTLIGVKSLQKAKSG